MAIKNKYTDQEHYLIRSMVMIAEIVAYESSVLADESIAEIVGKPIPKGTFKMVHKDAVNTLCGAMTFDQYFKRTSQSKRKGK